MDSRIAYMDYCVDWLLARKSVLVRADRRHRTAIVVATVAYAAANNDTKGFYAGLRALQPWKSRPLPVLKKLDGSFAQSFAEIAARWIEHFSLELGGVPS